MTDANDAAGDAVRAAATVLEQRAPAFAADAATEIHRRVPELPASLAVTTQTTSAVRELIAVFARGLLRDLAPDELIVPEETLEHARLYVRRGVEMPMLLRTYRVGHAVMWELWTGLLDAETDDPRLRVTLRDRTGERLFGFIDAITGRVVDEYHAERERWSRSAAARRIATVRDLLDGQPVDPAAASRVLGRELGRTHVGFVAWTTSGQDAVGAPQRLQRAGEAFAVERGDARPLLVPVGHRVLWGWCSPSAVPAAPSGPPAPSGDDVRVAVGEPASGVDGFRLTHRQALAARRVALLADGSADAAVAWADVAVLGLLSADLDLARDFALRELGDLGADDAASVRLRETLRAFLAEGEHVGRTAAQLDVHVNTVTNRLRQCEAALGRPLRERRAELHAALALRDGLRSDGA